MTQPPPGQRNSDSDSGAQVSQGPSGDNGAEGLGGADAVPETPDTNFNPDASDTDPERRGSALNGEDSSDQARPDA